MMSMTGYGRALKSVDGRNITVELRSVNHRFLDISLRVPRAMGFLEDGIRKAIGEKLTRGHIDVSISYQNLRKDAREVTLDEALALQYSGAVKKLNVLIGLDETLGLDKIASYPEVLSVSEAPEDEEALKSIVFSALGEALDRLIAMRSAEGERMMSALKVILDEIDEKSREIDLRYPETVKEYSKRLSERLNDLVSGGLDPQRIAQEVAIMADKAAVDEETVRLRSHVQHAKELCKSAQPVGRTLDFLVQEMNREVNTITSKSQDLPITEACLKCKSAIEKLREQLQNVE